MRFFILSPINSSSYHLEIPFFEKWTKFSSIAIEWGEMINARKIELFYNVLVDRMKAIPHHSRKLANFMILAQNITWFRIKRKVDLENSYSHEILWIETWVFRYGWWSIDIPHSTMEGHALQAKGFFWFFLKQALQRCGREGCKLCFWQNLSLKC